MEIVGAAQAPTISATGLSPSAGFSARLTAHFATDPASLSDWPHSV